MRCEPPEKKKRIKRILKLYITCYKELLSITNFISCTFTKFQNPSISRINHITRRLIAEAI